MQTIYHSANNSYLANDLSFAYIKIQFKMGSQYDIAYNDNLLTIINIAANVVIRIAFNIKKFKRPKHTVYSVRAMFVHDNSNKNINIDNVGYAFSVQNNKYEIIEHLGKNDDMKNIPDNVKMNRNLIMLGIYNHNPFTVMVFNINIGYKADGKLIDEFSFISGETNTSIFVPL